jgi:hypothetical protein
VLRRRHLLAPRRQHLIDGRDPTRGQIVAKEVDVPYYTRAKTDKETEILAELRSRPMQAFSPSLAVSR